MKCNKHARVPLRAIGEGNQLVLSPLAYLKLLFFCHAATTEVGMFGISSAEDSLLVDDVVLVKQRTSSVTVVFDDAAVADHFDRMAESGISPARCGRIWIHTHPGSSASPSTQDEMTFAKSFGGCDWSVMAIIAKGGERYARLQFPAGPGGQMELEITAQWQALPKFLSEYQEELPRLIAEWRENLQTLVHPEATWLPGKRGELRAASVNGSPGDDDFFTHSTGIHLHHPDRMELDDVEWAFLQAWEEGAYV